MDSHWNNLGASIVFEELMRNTGKIYESYLSKPYTTENIHKGDLYAMLYPSGEKLDEQIVFDHDFSYEYISDFRSEEDIIIETACEDKDGSIVVYRDSFCNALLPMLADEFSVGTFTREMPYDLTLVNNGVTAVVAELVERNVENLLLSAPVMPAPEREHNDSYRKAEINHIYTREKDSMLHIYGSVKNNFKEVLVCVDSVFYEAFPVYEAELLDGEKSVKSGGFSLYVPLDKGEREITVYVK